MPVDPKYAGLPGIAWDQPDTFETVEGADGDDESVDTSEAETEDQEKLHMTSLSWIGDIEVGADEGKEETLLQRFMRLRCEIGELVDDLDSMTESTREASQSEGLSIQVKNLIKQLETCQFNDEVNTTSKSNVELDAMAKQIDALKNSSKVEKTDGEGVYQIFLSNDKKASVDIANLDGRLAMLEKIVGHSSPADRKVLSAQTDSQNLEECVKILDDRKSFLNQQHIEHVEGRLSALTFKINSISEQKVAVENATKDEKVNKLANLVSSQSSMAAGLLPEIVERMENVSMLQDNSKTWSDTVDSVQQQQRETKDVIKDTEKLVVDTRECFDKNMTEIFNKCNLLQSKLAEIKT